MTIEQDWNTIDLQCLGMIYLIFAVYSLVMRKAMSYDLDLVHEQCKEVGLI